MKNLRSGSDLELFPLLEFANLIEAAMELVLFVMLMCLADGTTLRLQRSLLPAVSSYA